MATLVALKPLESVQIGLEATAGTAVAAISRLTGSGYLKEIIDRDRGNEARGILATAGPLVTLARATELGWSSDLTPHDALWPLVMGLHTPSISGAGPYVWTFAPSMTIAPTMKSATIECREWDGATAHIYNECQYALCSKMKFSGGGAKQRCKVEWTAFGRARQSATLTAAITVPTDRDAGILVGGNTTMYIDDGGGTIGSTAVAGILRSWELEIDTGLMPDFTQDGRSDLDYATHRYGQRKSKLKAVVELNSVGAAEYAKWRSNGRRLIRIKSTNGAGNIVQLDGAYDYTAADITEDGDYKLISLDAEGVYDSTWAKWFEAIITVTGVATVAALTGA